MKYLIFVFLLLFVSCGGGGNNSVPINLQDVSGDWTGSVELFENGCPRVIPQEAQTLFFTHSISVKSNTPTESDVILNDGIGDCLALRVSSDANSFFAVCPERTLVDFIDGYDCREELTWLYTIEDPTGTAQVNPVVRTASVRCYQNNEIQFVCPVEYRGNAGRCIRGLC